MITPAKSAVFEWVFSHHVRLLLTLRFAGVHIRGVENLRAATGSVLLISNHVSWWDGLLYLLANRIYFQRDAYVCMSETGLRKYPFFRRLGAYSVSEEATGTLQSLRYSASLLMKPHTLLLFFPQGQQRHQELRPLGFRDGIGTLLRTLPSDCPVSIIPTALHYTFLESAKPEVFLDVGKPILNPALHHAGSKLHARAISQAITLELEHKLSALLDKQRESLLQLDSTTRKQPPHYETLIRRRVSL